MSLMHHGAFVNSSEIDLIKQLTELILAQQNMYHHYVKFLIIVNKFDGDGGWYHRAPEPDRQRAAPGGLPCGDEGGRARGAGRDGGAGHVQLPLGAGRGRDPAHRGPAPHGHLRLQRRHGGRRWPSRMASGSTFPAISPWRASTTRRSRPPSGRLTTVHQPIMDMAGAAVNLLMKQIRAERDATASRPNASTS